MISVPTSLAAFLGTLAAFLAVRFLDELVGLEVRARTAAREVRDAL